MAPLLELADVKHEYAGNRRAAVTALQDLSLHVDSGEIVAIVGLSGCGKTTLLRLAAGLAVPSSGRIRIDAADPDAFRRTRQLSFVFQKSLLFPWRTVRSNLLLPNEISSVLPPAIASERADNLLRLLGLAGFADAYPRQLSGGMLQRAALARALLLTPRILFLDEPFGALDELTREQLWVEFSAIWKQEGTTVVLVTHSIREAVFLADRALVMTPRPGRISSEYPVPFPKPRTHDITTTREFTDLCERIRRSLGK
jgi:NitT/TauT family transport system ATP-binding protein